MLEILARASIEGACLVSAVWIVTRALPHLPPAAKAMLWWCAAAKVVVTLAWVTPVAVPILPVDDTVIQAPVASDARHPAAASALPASVPRLEAGPGAGTVAEGWQRLLIALWAAGLCASAGLALRAWRLARGLVKRSMPAGAPLQSLSREIADSLGLRRAPEVRVSADVESPLITGSWRPVVLVPEPRFAQLSAEQQRMALCHELAHVRRGDVWLGCVPAVAERIFFFHPLVRLAAREYAFWREAACDAAVLAALGTGPQAYGRLLLDLGVARPPASLAAAGAAWSFANLKRRIIMLNQPSTPSTAARIAGAAIVAAALVAVAPLKFVARPSAAPAVVPHTAAFTGPAPGPVASEIQPSEGQPREDRLTFVFLRSDEHTTMSGSSEDMARARRVRQGGEPLLWFRKDGREYVIRDAALLREVEAIWEPVSRLGEEQGQVGTKQGVLGSKQGEIGTKQGELGTEQGILGTRQGVLGTRQGVLASRETRRLSAAERAELEREQQAIEKEMRDLDRQMQALTDKMRELDKPIASLGDEMEVLGREMEVLGRKMQEASARAENDMRALIARAIAGGSAQAVR